MFQQNYWFQNLDNFVMTPKALIKNPRYSGLSADEILIYSLMVDRMKLSAQNENFMFQTGVFIYFPLSEITAVLHCSENKARKVLLNLQNAGLIIRAYQGQGKAAKIVPLRYREQEQ